MIRIKSFIYIPFILVFFFGGKINAQNVLKSSGQFPVLGWYGIPADETSVKRYQEMKDAGFTTNFSFLGNAGNVQASLDTALAAGMKVIISCGELSDDPENTVKRFMNHPALAGYFLRDEPVRSDFPGLAAWAKRIQAVDNTHFCYLNLHPGWQTPKYLGNKDYRDYVHTFLNEVPVEILSYDHYPITGDSVRSFRQEYYENLEIIADEAKKAGKPFWAFTMATAIKGAYPIPTVAEIRLQVFCDLVYGAQGIQFLHTGLPVAEASVSTTDQSTMENVHRFIMKLRKFAEILKVYQEFSWDLINSCMNIYQKII